MDINIKETNKGQKCIIVDGHRYRIDITLTNGDISWRCVVKGCKSRLRTGADVHLVLNEKKNVHSHRPDDRQVERHILMGSTKHRAVDALSARPSKIIRTELQSMVKEPRKNGIMRLSPYLHVFIFVLSF
jgi:hypothetical protein